MVVVVVTVKIVATAVILFSPFVNCMSNYLLSNVIVVDGGGGGGDGDAAVCNE